MYALASKITFICQMDFNAFPVDIQVIKYSNVDWYHGYKSFSFDPLKQFKQKVIKFSSSHLKRFGIYNISFYDFRSVSSEWEALIILWTKLFSIMNSFRKIQLSSLFWTTSEYILYSPTLLVLTISRPGNFCKSDHAPPAATVVAVFMWKTPSLINSRRSCILDVRYF